MIVMKFGGTSNSDAAAMRNVVHIVKAHLSEKPFVVISAIAGATNALESIARKSAGGDSGGAEAILERLFNQHRDIARQLLKKSGEGSNQVLNTIDTFQSELRKLVAGVSILKELTPRTMDVFCSFGERLSSRIIAEGLRESGVDAVWLDVKDFMITDENYGRAMPVMDSVRENLERVARPLINAGQVPVTQGFIGITPSGRYTTMGRESSDFSASIIGAGMNASRVQIWTDVDGILSADPRVVHDARRIGKMSFEEAFELSYFGAKVLHPNTMLPLLAGNIPVEIRNSNRKDDVGTLVDLTGDAEEKSGRVKSIAFHEGLSLVTVTPHRRLNQYLFWEEIFSVLSRHNIVVGNLTTSEYNVAFTVHAGTDMDVLESDLAQFGDATIHGGKGSICVVGAGFLANRGAFSRIIEALEGFPISMVSLGASGLSTTIILDEPEIAHAVEKVHAAIFPDQTDGTFSTRK
jgi:aspartate kinase